MSKEKVKKTYSLEVESVKLLEEMAEDKRRKISNQLDIIIQDYYSKFKKAS